LREVDAVRRGVGKVASVPPRSPIFRMFDGFIRGGAGFARGRFSLGGVVPGWAGLCANAGFKKLTNEVKSTVITFESIGCG
jgi:hypothetical protein